MGLQVVCLFIKLTQSTFQNNKREKASSMYNNEAASKNKGFMFCERLSEIIITVGWKQLHDA